MRLSAGKGQPATSPQDMGKLQAQLEAVKALNTETLAIQVCIRAYDQGLSAL
jgi:hypothetical protein